MTSLQFYDIKIPYDGDESNFYAFRDALMEKFSDLKIFNVFNSDQEQLDRPTKAFKARQRERATEAQDHMITTYQTRVENYKSQTRQCVSKILSALGPCPRALVMHLYEDDSVSDYAKAHRMMDLLQATYGANSPATSGRMKWDILELPIPSTFKEALDMVAKMLLLNMKLKLVTGEPMSDIVA